MEQDKLPYTETGADRERFERVWRRVMPTDRPDCPFTLSDAAAPNETEHRLMPSEPIGAWPREEMPQEEVSLSAAPAPTLALPGRGMPPPENDVPCLGVASGVHGSLLQTLIADELSDWRTYRAMAQRVSGRTAKILSGIAADERRHAKRLAAAYFLISGVHYWPDRMPAAPGSTFLGALRARFVGEQQGEAAYRAAAAETADRWLQELFLELAGDESAHAWLLRGILEQ